MLAALIMLTVAQQTFDMTLVRTFDAPVEKVWQAWSEPKLVMQWWGPKGFTCPVAKMDFRKGGISLVCMRFGKQDMYNTWTYTRIEKYKRLEYLFHFSDKDGKQIDPAAMGVPKGVPKEVPHVVVFKSLGPKTEITFTEHGYTTEAAGNISKLGMEQCLDKMAALFKEKSND